MNLIFTDADGFERAAQGASLLVVSFSLREVTDCRIGDALDRLLNLTDSIEQSERFAHAMLIQFECFDLDSRELFEIPEVVRFFRTLTEQWSAWYHFLTDNAEVHQFRLLFALLCDVEVARAGGQIRTRFRSQEQVSSVEQQLVNGLMALYQHHAWPPQRLSETILTARHLAFGE